MKIEQSTAGSYFMACGWNGGYFGVQELGDGKKVAIFSVWDTARGDDPGAVKEQDRVEVMHQDEGARIKRFGGEGTGAQCMLDWPWEIGQTNRFLVRADSSDGKTAFLGFIFEPRQQKWRHLVTFRRRGSGGLSGLYSFVEDFRRDGRSAHDARRAEFQNGWVQTVQSGWRPVLKARFTASNAKWESRDNINAGTNNSGWFLATGGEIKMERVLNSVLDRSASTNRVPSDLPALPPAVPPQSGG
jgi:hypothetical protein